MSPQVEPHSDRFKILRGSPPSRIDPEAAPTFPNRFRSKIFMYITVLSLTTAMASAGIYYWRQLGFIEKDRTRRSRTLLTTLAAQAELGAYAGDAALCELAARSTLTEEDVVLVAVYDRRGREILHFTKDNQRPPPPQTGVMRTMLASPDARPERHPGDGFEDLYASIVTGVRDPAEALSVGPGGPAPRREVVGVARVGLSLQPAQQQLTEVLVAGAGIAVGLIVLGILAALLISRAVSRPILELTHGVDQIRTGHLDARVEIKAKDEIGQLGYSFNRMAERLAETMTALETLNRDLEDEVARRTLAIQRAAMFTELLNAPMGTLAEKPGVPLAGGGTATGTLARLLNDALHALIVGTGARSGAALLTREEAVEFELEVAWFLEGVAGEFGAPPGEKEIAAGVVFHDGKRLVVPLMLGDEPHGCILLLCDSKPPPDVIQYASHASSQLAIAVSNTRTYSALHRLARELKERNEALAKQRDQLREMNRLKSEFLANTSHELRTPLNAILGYTELIGEGIYGAVSGEQKTALDGIDESGKNLLLLINNILDLSKVESGKMTVHFEDEDLSELTRTVINETAPLAKDRPYKVQLSCFGKPRLRTDGNKVKQIIINLISNAIKFTAQGRVDVTVRADAAGGCTIAVRDSGIGIRPEDQRLIFEEFRQVDGSYTRTYGGTGLGLAIARRLAEMLGGQISVESKLGQGSTFSLRLPKEPPPPVPTSMISTLPPGTTLASMLKRTSPPPMPPPLPPGAQKGKG